MESHRPFYKDDYTVWMLDPDEARAELEAVEASERAANDDLIQELLMSRE